MLEKTVELKTLKRRSLGAIFGIILSRFSGIFRTLIINASFGFSFGLDAFNAAFRLPNGLRDLFADGAFSAAFIKAYADARVNGYPEEKKLIALSSGFFLCLTTIISIIFCFFSDTIIAKIVADDFKQTESFYLASALFKILAFYLPFTMLNALAMAVLSVHGKTFRAMNASIFLNIGMIFGALVLSPLFMMFHVNGIFGLAFGSLIGVILQMIYQFKPLYDLKLISYPSFDMLAWKHYQPLKEILLLMTPRAIAQGALTLALLVNTYFATSLGTGMLTYIVTAVIIIQVPIGLFGVSMGFSAQSMLTEALQEKNISKFSSIFTHGLEKTLALTSIFVLGLSFLIVPFYHFIFEYGKISYTDTIYNSLAVCAYSIGILFSAGSKVIISAFFAFNRTRYLVINAMVYLLTSSILSATLTPKLGLLGLGISYGTSTALDFLLNIFIFYFIFFKKYQKSPYEQSYLFPLKIAMMGIFSYLVPLCGFSLIKSFWVHFKF